MKLVRLFLSGVLGVLLLGGGFPASAEDRAFLQLERSALDIAQRLDDVVGEVQGIERGLEGPAKDLRNLVTIYKTTCGSDVDDPGCADLLERTRLAYVEILDTLGPALPELRHDVTKLSHRLQDDLYPAVARPTPQQLYREIQSSVEMPTPGSDMPLSASLKQLADLLGGYGRSGMHHVLEATLATQADLLTSTRLIQLLEVLVARERIVVARPHAWGKRDSGGFVKTMALVRDLFGLDTGVHQDPPPNRLEGQGNGWVSTAS